MNFDVLEFLIKLTVSKSVLYFSNELEAKSTANYSQLNQNLGIMSMKFDKIITKLFPHDEEESTTSSMDTGDGEKIE